MAIDMSTENTSLVVSPRISFSHDLCHTGSSHGGDDDDAAETTTTTTTEDKRCRRRDSSLLDLGNSDDFDFCSGNIEFQTSSAEELFSNGLIRTVQFQEKLVTSVSSKPRQPTNINKTTSSSSSSMLPPLPTTTNGISISKQEIVSSNSDHQQNNSKIQSKSFWRIKRSSSLHCDNIKSSFWSLPLLSRSNSTGSVQPNTNHPPKSSSTVKQQNGNSRHQQQQQQQQMKNNNVSGISSSTFYVYPLSQKPPLRRNYLGHNNGMNGVRINPVLNVPSPHISKGTANLLGLGSFFRNGKDKKIVKK